MSKAFLGWSLIFLLTPALSHAVDLSDTPLASTILTPPPIVMFVLDNSGSMNVEFATDEAQGLFNGYYYLFPDTAYDPAPDHELGSGHAATDAQRLSWRSQWEGYNRIYYSPRRIYRPWPSTVVYNFDAADVRHPASNPVSPEDRGPSLKPAANFFSVRAGSRRIEVVNAHYFTHHDADGDHRWDQHEPIYLVTWQDRDRDGVVDLGDDLSRDQRLYFKLKDDGDGLVEDSELEAVSAEAEKNLIRPALTDSDGRFLRWMTDREELQNFANWFTYHRRREYAAKAFASHAITQLKDTSAGLYAVNGSARLPARLIADRPLSDGGAPIHNQMSELLNALYGMKSSGRTALRSALDQVGRYMHGNFDSDLGDTPFCSEEKGGGCQRATAVVISDGFWNGSFSGIGNADANCGRSYSDAWADTLADVAMTYYQADLMPELTDRVPATTCDPAIHQHMNTHAFSFGFKEERPWEMDVDAVAGAARCMSRYMENDIRWPRPTGVSGLEGGIDGQSMQPDVDGDAALADDFKHAALNGRGGHFGLDASPAIIGLITGGQVVRQMWTGVGALAVDATRPDAPGRIYQTRYHSGDWRGEILARSLDEKALANDDDGPLWRASEYLDTATATLWDQRRIVTYGGRCNDPQGIAFRYSELADSQRIVLGSDLTPGSAADQNARDLLNYIRGKSIDRFRKRETLLGDMVHSGPVLFNKTLFAGANDGLLHAFDAGTGIERFAYAPALVLDHLNALADPYYADRHRYYVDGPLYIGEVLVGEYSRHTYLVGALGKGGKGCFCLLAGKRHRPTAGDDYEWTFQVDDLDRSRSEEDIAAAVVQWEYPRPNCSDDGMDNDGDGFADETDEDDPNIGYGFGQAFAVNANCDANQNRPVVVFGNGYGSDSRKALLYILSADSGDIIRIIDTGAGQDNGLSTPALIDADLDRRVDYAYAGDLNGNMWKFDLTGSDPDQWGVAYGVDNNGDGVIDAAHGDLPTPLFQAPGQSITGRPDVMAMAGVCLPQAGGFMVLFGTGRYLGRGDMTDTARQSIYAVWDYGDDGDDSEYLGCLIDREAGTLSSGLSLFKKQIVDEGGPASGSWRQLSTDMIAYDVVEDGQDGDGFSGNNKAQRQACNPLRYAGWFFDFPPPDERQSLAAERVIGDAQLHGGKLIVPSYVPDAAPCSVSGGHSWLYIIEALSGNPAREAGQQAPSAQRFEGKISGRLIISEAPADYRRDLIIFSDQFGQIQCLETTAEKWGRVYWRQSR